MFYKKYLPAAPLRPYINWFYILEVEASVARPLELTAIANPSCAMVFNYGERYHITNPYYQQEWLPESFLSGISTAPYRLHFSGSIGSLGVIFRTAAFRDIFHLPEPQALAGCRLVGSFFLGKDSRFFCEQLAEAPSHQARIELTDAWFLKMFARKPAAIHPADRALDIIMQNRGLVSMDSLSRALCLSPRQLRRVFLERTGASPKFLARMKRFSYAHNCLTSGSQRWQDFLGDNGFYDQSHLIRDFKLFSGNTPTAQQLSGRLRPETGR